MDIFHRNESPFRSSGVSRKHGHVVNYHSHFGANTESKAASPTNLWFTIKNIQSGSLIQCCLNTPCVFVLNKFWTKYFKRYRLLFQRSVEFPYFYFHTSYFLNIGMKHNISRNSAIRNHFNIEGVRNHSGIPAYQSVRSGW